MKETTVTETRVGIEGDGVAFTRAEITLGRPDALVAPAVVMLPREKGHAEIRVWQASEAAMLAKVFGRIFELLDEHEKQLALRDCAGALSNTSEHGRPDTPAA